MLTDFISCIYNGNTKFIQLTILYSLHLFSKIQPIMLQITVNEAHQFSVANENGQWSLNNDAVSLDVHTPASGITSLLINNKSYTAIVEKVDRKNKEITLKINGLSYVTSIKEPIDQLLSNMGLNLKANAKVEPIKAPMPGMVLRIMVQPGQQVNKGDGLIVLEAMKMENILKATGPATIKAIKIEEKTAVEKGTILIELE